MAHLTWDRPGIHLELALDSFEAFKHEATPELEGAGAWSHPQQVLRICPLFFFFFPPPGLIYALPSWSGWEFLHD